MKNIFNEPLPKPINSFSKFSTLHPVVNQDEENKKNAILMAWSYNDLNLVIPTVINGKQLSNKDAIDLAIKNGVDKYPHFASAQEAFVWAMLKNNSINEDGSVV